MSVAKERQAIPVSRTQGTKVRACFISADYRNVGVNWEVMPGERGHVGSEPEERATMCGSVLFATVHLVSSIRRLSFALHLALTLSLEDHRLGPRARLKAVRSTVPCHATPCHASKELEKFCVRRTRSVRRLLPTSNGLVTKDDSGTGSCEAANLSPLCGIRRSVFETLLDSIYRSPAGSQKSLTWTREMSEDAKGKILSPPGCVVCLRRTLRRGPPSFSPTGPVGNCMLIRLRCSCPSRTVPRRRDGYCVLCQPALISAVCPQITLMMPWFACVISGVAESIAGSPSGIQITPWLLRLWRLTSRMAKLRA